MRIDRYRLAGIALIVGAVLFFTFWILSATDSEQSLIEPWPLQVAFHGVQILALAGGLLLSLGLPIDGWPGLVWRVGVVAAVVGTPISLQVFAGGMLLIGVAALFTAGLRPAGVPLISGAILWIVLFSRGAIIGNESAPPLDDAERILAVVGLGLIAIGLILLGASIRRFAQAVSPGSTAPGSDGPLRTSQSTPATTTAPTTNSHPGGS